MDDLTKLVTAMTAFLAALTPLLVWFYRIVQTAKERSKDARDRSIQAERRSITAIEFLLRRGKAEAVQRGLVTQDGRLSELSYPVYEPLFGKLNEYRIAAKFMNDGELFQVIESDLGNEIAEKVCMKLKIYEAACIFLSIMYLRNHNMTAPETEETPALGKAPDQKPG
jgi:hypothetical protein